MSDKVDWATLYDDPQNGYNNIELSDTVVNYKYVEIYFADAIRSGCQKLDNPNGKVTLLFTSSVGSTGNYANFKVVSLSGNSISVVGRNQLALITSGIVVNDVNNIAITKVIGYR